MIMKKNNIYKMLLAMAATMLICHSCDPIGNEDDPEPEPGIVEPVFPALVENYSVEPGSVQEITFTPNMDWTISVPSDTKQSFWIVDGSFQVTDLSGEKSASPVTVRVGVTQNAEFDKNLSCEVTMTMGEKSQVVAKYMLPAKERVLTVCLAERNEDGSLKLGEDGESYVYASAEAEEVSLEWSAADASFMAPVRVESNFEWSIQLPEWLDVSVPQTTTGIVDLIFTGESLETLSGKIVFKPVGSSSDVIKELDVTIPSCNDIEVYSAKVSDGELEYADEGYAYTEQPVSELALVWLGTDFRMPIKVDSKCSWEITCPEWVTVSDLPDKTTGEVLVTLRGVPSKYPVDGAEGKVVFKKDDATLKEIKITIPECRDIMSYSVSMSLTELVYSYDGNVKTSAGFEDVKVTGSVYGVKDVRIFAVETTGGVVGKTDPEWFKYTVSAWNAAENADVLQERELAFSVSENLGAERSAKFFILPPTVTLSAAELFNEDATVKDDYKIWSVPVVQQSKNYDEYIEMEAESDPAYPYTFVRVDDPAKKDEITAAFGATDFIYTLTYGSPYSRDNAFMLMALPFESYKVYDGKDMSDKSGVAGFWLSYVSGGDTNTYGVIDMYNNEMKLPHEPSTGYVVFYSNDERVLAVVECISPFEPEVLTVDKEVLQFTSSELEGTFAIKSNTEWTVESSEDWCVVSPASGSNDADVRITLSELKAMDDRYATLTVRSATITHTIRVEQLAGDVLAVDVETLEFESLESSAVMKVSSNVSWTIESNADWCTVTPASGANSATVTVSVARNTVAEDRTAVLTLTSSSVTATVTVTQKAGDAETNIRDEYGNLYDVNNDYFVDQDAAKTAGAKLYELKEGPYYDQYKEVGCPMLLLEYTSADAEVEVKVPSKIKWFQVMQWSYNEYIVVNDMTVYETSGIMDKSTDVVRIKMLPEVASLKDEIEKNGGIKLLLHKNMSTQDPTLVIFCRLTLAE